MNTMMDAVTAVKALRGFVGRQQLRVMADAMRGEEGQWFIDKAVEMAERVKSMPKTYETDGQGAEAVAHLRYFLGGMDWHITERDVDADGAGQVQAFGWADLGHGGELGYVSIVELIGLGAELDLHFKPTPLGACTSCQLASS